MLTKAISYYQLRIITTKCIDVYILNYAENRLESTIKQLDL